MNTSPNDNNQQSKDPSTSQQYQNVFDKYSEELKNKKTALDKPEDVKAITPPQEPIPVIPENNILKTVELPLETPQPNLSANIEVDEPTSSLLKREPSVLTPETPLVEYKNEPPLLDSIPKSGSNLFKILFIISLVIFLAVSGVIAYVLIGKDMFTSQNKTNQTKTDSNIDSQTIANQEYICFLNDKKYKTGETFQAADNCNVCSCNSDATISCTEKTCDIPLTPTKTATQSASDNPDTQL